MNDGGSLPQSRRSAAARRVPALLSALVLLSLAPLTPAEAASPGFFHFGGAFGTSTRVGSPFISGSTAASASTGLVAPGCTGQAGISTSNSVASVNEAPSVVTGTVYTTGERTATDTLKSTRMTAKAQAVSLLDGLVTADVARAVSTTTHDPSGFQVSGAGSSFENLVIRGRPPQSVTPGPNTEVELFGFGRVILNEQIPKVLSSSAVLTVNAIHVFITMPNDLAIPVGTEIVVSHAKAGLVGPVPQVLDGQAYGTSVNVDDAVTSGPSALRVMPCQGTDGEEKVNSTASVVVPDILTTGVVTDTVRGTVDGTSASGATESTIRAVDLLGGLVQATGVQASAKASSTGSPLTLSDEGSSFLSLTVRGHPTIDADVPPNTTLSLAGLGKLHLRRVLRTANSIEVRMIELVVTDSSNPQGLPVGLNVRVGVAEASVL